MTSNTSRISLNKGLLSVSPIFVFLLVYLVTSLILGDFYKMPISVAMLIASIWAAFLLTGHSLKERIEVFSESAGNSNVMYMIWIFILAGAFASVAKASGAITAAVDISLNLLPTTFIVPGLFIVTCFISMAIGTSVGTVVALAPLAVEIAHGADASVPFFIAIVLGGAFFGDNLSFISDTTIAATRTQGCDMKDKFFANVRIVVPAALISLFLYCLNSPELHYVIDSSENSFWLVIPYFLVILLAVIGINVIVVLLAGIVAAFVAAYLQGNDLLSLFSIAGEGIEGVGGLIIITLLASGMLGFIKKGGGIEFLIHILSKNIKGKRGAKLGIVALVGIVNLCTANNTVAILTVGSMAKRIAALFHISPKKTASLLDSGSCVTQSLIPYGAQSLMAASIAGISPAECWRFLFYPQILLGCIFISVIFGGKKIFTKK